MLGKGDDPRTPDLLHLVVSLEKEEDFKRLGSSEESRQCALRDTTRDTMRTMADALSTDDLRWVAGIHQNTDNPHVHLLIHRDYADRQSFSSNGQREGSSRRIVIEKNADRLLGPVSADHSPAREIAPQLIPARVHVSYPDHQHEMTFER